MEFVNVVGGITLGLMLYMLGINFVAFALAVFRSDKAAEQFKSKIYKLTSFLRLAD
ncbi:MAG: hypothetical protein AAGI89_00725 [Pseudomonadota bacterium]